MLNYWAPERSTSKTDFLFIASRMIFFLFFKNLRSVNLVSPNGKCRKTKVILKEWTLFI